MRQRISAWMIVVTMPVAMVGLAVLTGCSSEKATQGVVERTFELPGPVRVFVMQVGRDQADLSLQVGWPQGRRNFTQREAVSTIVGHYHEPPKCEVLAAMNASFFDPAPKIVGMAASGGEIAQQPDGRFQTLLRSTDGTFSVVERLKHEPGEVLFADGTRAELAGYNCDRTADSIVAYTPQWAPTTCTTQPGVEVVLRNVDYPMHANKKISGVVTAVHRGQDAKSVFIPEGGMVLSARGKTEAVLLERAKLGQVLNVVVRSSEKAMNTVDFAIGGVGWLVKDGAVNSDNLEALKSSFAMKKHPRTAIAWSDKHYYLIAVDGRSERSVGMTLPELATFCIDEFDADGAFNLDGGGSTTFWSRGEVRNVPSDGQERQVANVVMVVREVCSCDGDLPEWGGRMGMSGVRDVSKK